MLIIANQDGPKPRMKEKDGIGPIESGDRCSIP